MIKKFQQFIYFMLFNISMRYLYSYVVLVSFFTYLYVTNIDGFYFFSLKHEKETQDIEHSIAEELKISISQNLSNQINSDFIQTQSHRFNLENITIYDLSISEVEKDLLTGLIQYQVSFKFALKGKKRNDIEKEITIPMSEIIYERFKTNFIFQNNTENCKINLRIKDMPFSNFSELLKDYNISNANYLELDVERKIFDNITALQKINKGFPATDISFRMFYFSVVTVTTLGYGDIIPISRFTRNLVTLESIFGVILIGAFLNSLKNKD